jgi:hypothetical protein
MVGDDRRWRPVLAAVYADGAAQLLRCQRLLIPSMRTLGSEVARGRWGSSVADGGLSEPLAVDYVAVLVHCTVPPSGVAPTNMTYPLRKSCSTPSRRTAAVGPAPVSRALTPQSQALTTKRMTVGCTPGSCVQGSAD